MLTTRDSSKTLAKGFKGTIRHVANWMTSSRYDVVYPNPHFDPIPLEGTEYENGVGVYFIHGTADRTSAFDFFARQLLPDLPASVSSLHLVAFNQRGQGLGIMDFAKQFIQKIRANRHRHVIVFAHSRGGLVAWAATYFAKLFGLNFEGIFTLGTPFGGSDFAIALLRWFSNSVDEMKPGSEFLQKLCNHIRKSNIPAVAFAAAADELVKLNASFVPGKHFPIVLPHHTHLSMPYSYAAINHSRIRLHRLCPVLRPLRDLRPIQNAGLEIKTIPNNLKFDEKDQNEYEWIEAPKNCNDAKSIMEHAWIEEYFQAEKPDDVKSIDRSLPTELDAIDAGYEWIEQVNGPYTLIDSSDIPLLSAISCDIDYYNSILLQERKLDQRTILIFTTLKLFFLDMLENNKPNHWVSEATSISQCIIEITVNLIRKQSATAADEKSLLSYFPGFFPTVSFELHPFLKELIDKYRDVPIPITNKVLSKPQPIAKPA